VFWRLPLIRSIEPPSAGVCRCQVFGAMAGEEVEADVWGEMDAFPTPVPYDGAHPAAPHATAGRMQMLDVYHAPVPAMPERTKRVVVKAKELPQRELEAYARGHALPRPEERLQYTEVLDAIEHDFEVRQVDVFSSLTKRHDFPDVTPPCVPVPIPVPRFSSRSDRCRLWSTG